MATYFIDCHSVDIKPWIYMMVYSTANSMKIRRLFGYVYLYDQEQNEMSFLRHDTNVEVIESVSSVCLSVWQHPHVSVIRGRLWSRLALIFHYKGDSLFCARYIYLVLCPEPLNSRTPISLAYDGINLYCTQFYNYVFLLPNHCICQPRIMAASLSCYFT